MKMAIKKKYHLYDQYQLKNLADMICDDIEGLLSYLGISSYKIFDKMITMSCPIHGGDNDSAFNLYYTGDTYRGNWKCRTHGCETTFKSSIIGFIRGCLSHQEKNWCQPGDDMISFDEALQVAIEYAKCDPKQLKQSRKSKEKHSFINAMKNISGNNETNNQQNLVSRNVVKKLLNIPSPYFISRGFSDGILIKYDVGDCIGQGKEMSNRAVVPVYDIDYTGMLGCTGRSIFDKCDSCGYYHTDSCPDPDHRWLYSKWKHNKNFKTQECLYNYWFAKEYIQKTKTVIIVESPGNVWRLEEADIHNSVAIFGASMSHKQKMILDTSGAMNIITIMDNDSAGSEAAKQIEEKCGRTYNIKHIKPQTSDVAEMTPHQIKQDILPQIQDYIC